MMINIKSSWLSHTHEKIIWRLTVSLVSDPTLILWVHMASMCLRGNSGQLHRFQIHFFYHASLQLPAD